MSAIASFPAHTIPLTLDLLSVYAGLLALIIFHYFDCILGIAWLKEEKRNKSFFS